jgi:hypothetical protein
MGFEGEIICGFLALCAQAIFSGLKPAPFHEDPPATGLFIMTLLFLLTPVPALVCAIIYSSTLLLLIGLVSFFLFLNNVVYSYQRKQVPPHFHAEGRISPR